MALIAQCGMRRIAGKNVLSRRPDGQFCSMLECIQDLRRAAIIHSLVSDTDIHRDSNPGHTQWTNLREIDLHIAILYDSAAVNNNV